MDASPNNNSKEIQKSTKIKCALSTCATDFEPTNSKKRYCCDACRFRGYKERHAPKLKFLKSWQDQFKLNAAGLKKLFDLGEEHPTQKELIIAGFDFSVRDQQRKTSDGRKAFIYFDYALIIEENKPYQIYHHKP